MGRWTAQRIIEDYGLDGMWHEIRIRDAKVGTLKLSTKRPDIGRVARDAFKSQTPVQIEWEPKKNGAPGEGYINQIFTVPAALPGIQLRADAPPPLTDADIPF